MDICCPRNPFLSDYPDYFNVGEWPRNDFEDYISRHPDISWEHVHDVLSYFDVMNLSQWVTCPVMMGIGVQDPTCPPRTNMADYNNLSSSEKVLRVFGECRHGVEPGYNAELSEWINKHMLY